MNEKDEPKKLGSGWEHLCLRDSRTEDEKRAAQAAEYVRRKGCGRKD